MLDTTDGGRMASGAIEPSLLRQIWGERVSENSEPVRTFVKKLRGKLGDDSAHPAYIFNERGVGYRMAAPGDR